MRILFLIQSLSGGGAERQMSCLAPALYGMGHEVHIAFLYDGPCVPYEALREVSVHQLRAKNNYDPFILWQILRLIRKIRPDIVQSWIPQMDIIGGIAGRLTNTHWILHEQSSIAAFRSQWKNWLRVTIAGGANSIVSNSAGGAEYWRKALPGNSVSTIRNGLPLQYIEESNEDWYSDFVPGCSAKVIVYVGRLIADWTANKNVRCLIEAIPTVLERFPVFGVLCGDGPQREELEEFATKLGISDRLKFTGFLPETKVWSLLKRADVFVSLSLFEGFPNSVMEAIACNCPVVVSDIPAHREFLDEQTGWLVDPHNSSAVASAVIRVLSDTQESKKRSARAKMRSAEWSVSAMAKKFENLYQDVSKGKQA